MGKENLVSIITPSYNSSKFIEETIKSVLSQNYQDWEMIIVDDCSVDNSYEIAKRFSVVDCRIKVIRLEKNSGVAMARNAGINAANGRYIAFLDSDDLWLPQKLEKQIAFMREKDAVLSYTAYKKMDEAGRIRDGVVQVREKVSYSDLLSTCDIGCLTAIYDSHKIGKLLMPVVNHEDYALWLKILKKGFIAHGLNEPLAIYRVRKNSVSGNKLKAIKFQWNIYRNIEKLSLIDSMYYFTKYAYFGYKRFKS